MKACLHATCVLLIVALVPVVGGCSRCDADRGGAGSGESARPAPPPRPSLGELGREVGLVFPAGARLMGVARERGIDDLLRFKVDLPADQLAPFLAASPIPKEAFEPGEGGFLGPDEGFWDWSHASNLRTGQAIAKNGRVLNIGVADGSPAHAVLFIVWHST